MGHICQGTFTVSCHPCLAVAAPHLFEVQRGTEMARLPARVAVVVRAGRCQFNGNITLHVRPMMMLMGGWLMLGMHAGMRAKGGKADLALIAADGDAAAAGVFTTNVMAAAPVTYCREVLGRADAVRAVRSPPPSFLP